MSTTKVTVGIPTFNRSGFLREAIESVLAQSFVDFRLIVSDNASDDDTPEVVRSYSDERIEYVRHEQNVGAIGNINGLIALAETEYLVLLPDDDILYPGHLAAAMELLEGFHNIGLAHCAYERIDAESRVIAHINPLVCRLPTTIEKSDSALERLMLEHYFLCFPSVVYRTRAIVEAGGFREELGPFCDRDLWMRLALKWDFGYMATPLVGQRGHSGTTTTNVAAEQGVESNERERFRLYSRMNFQQRSDFLDGAPLPAGRVRRLRALAGLQLVVDEASAGLPLGEVAARLAKLLRTYPRIVLRRAFWRLVIAELGGRRVHSAIFGAATRHQRPVNTSANIISTGVLGSRSAKSGKA